MTTPILAILVAKSGLRGEVVEGLGAVSKKDHKLIEDDLRRDFADSIDFDAATKEGREQEHRWDYLLGHSDTGKVVGLEPHSAANKEISVVIDKRKNSIHVLMGHLKEGARIADWFWVASGEVDFVPHEKAVLRLAQNGITFVGKRLLKKHLVGDGGKGKKRGKQ